LSGRIERVLTTRQLNRALLARQLLLDRSTLPLTRALERVGGIQTQYAPSAYIGLWSRLHGFRRPALTRALEGRRAIQGTLMRVTIHTVSAGDYPLFAAALRKPRRDWWLRVHRKQLEGMDVRAVAARLREHLADGPLRAVELTERLHADGFPELAWSGGGVGLDLVRVPPSGTWERRRADLYALAESWIGPIEASEAEGEEHLVRRYLGGFGPASVHDIASWAGLPITPVRGAVDRLDLRRFRDQEGRELFDLPRAPLPEGDAPAPVRFLPTWDATLLAHARRADVLPEPYRPIVFGPANPQSLGTFLVDGSVAGSWRYENGGVRVEPFDPLPRRARGDVEEEARQLAAFHAG
jgi:hypothetical protein